MGAFSVAVGSRYGKGGTSKGYISAYTRVFRRYARVARRACRAPLRGSVFSKHHSLAQAVGIFFSCTPARVIPAAAGHFRLACLTQRWRGHGALAIIRSGH